MNNFVSVIIPTRHRSQLVTQAIRSVLMQSYDNYEIIVIIDGPDKQTYDILLSLNIAKLRIIELDKSVGAAEARNIGVDSAKYEWVAFLDDDDEWLPNKLELQLSLAVKLSIESTPIVVCKMNVKANNQSYSWPPVKYPTYLNDVASFLYCNRRFGKSAGIFVTSMLLTRKSLFYSTRFRKLPRFQDVDWLLRATKDNCNVVFAGINEVLLNHDACIDRPRISTHKSIHTCDFAIYWAQDMLQNKYINKTAYLHLVYGHISGMSKHIGGIKMFMKISLSGLVIHPQLPILFINHTLKWLLYRIYKLTVNA